MHKKTNGFPTLALLAAAFLWSLGGALIKTTTVDPLVTAGVRSLFGCLPLLLFVKWSTLKLDFWDFAGGAAYALSVILFVTSTKYTSASNAIVLQYTAPIWVVLLSTALIRERPAPIDRIAAVTTIIGAMLLLLSGKRGSLFGDVCAVANGLTYAVCIMVLRKKGQTDPVVPLLIGNCMTVAIAIPFIVGAGEYSLLARNLPLLAIMGIFQLGIPYLLFAYGISRVTAIRAILTAAIEPILNPLWAFLIVHERPTPMMIAGAAVILCAVTVRNLFSGRERRQEEPVAKVAR